MSHEYIIRKSLGFEHVFWLRTVFVVRPVAAKFRHRRTVPPNGVAAVVPVCPGLPLRLRCPYPLRWYRRLVVAVPTASIDYTVLPVGSYETDDTSQVHWPLTVLSYYPVVLNTLAGTALNSIGCAYIRRRWSAEIVWDCLCSIRNHHYRYHHIWTPAVAARRYRYLPVHAFLCTEFSRHSNCTHRNFRLNWNRTCFAGLTSYCSYRICHGPSMKVSIAVRLQSALPFS